MKKKVFPVQFSLRCGDCGAEFKIIVNEDGKTEIWKMIRKSNTSTITTTMNYTADVSSGTI